MDTPPLPHLPKPNAVYTKDYSSNSSRTSSTDKLCTLPEDLSSLSSSIRFNHKSAVRHRSNSASVSANLKLLSQNFKALSVHYVKFQGKSSTSAKANHLRLTLLKFLRLDYRIVTSADDLETITLSSSSRLTLVAKAGISIFSKYWLALVTDLTDNWNKISHVDRTCYLECISRLSSRKEWLFDKSQVYQDLLIVTLSFIFNKLFNLKTLSTGMHAFIGKFFNSCYFNLPDFAHILLFTLFVKNYSVKRHISTTLPSTQNVEAGFQEHLRELINYKGNYHHLYSKVPPDSKLFVMRCMNPPMNVRFDTTNPEFDASITIDLKDSNWVKRWAGFDSDIFRSFLKHYIVTCFELNPSVITPKEFTSNPGCILIRCHLMEILDSNITMLKNFKISQHKDSGNNQNNAEMFTFYSGGSKFSKSGNNYHYYLSNLPIVKILKVLQNLAFTLPSLPHTKVTIQFFESMFKYKASKITPYNSEVCEIIYDLYYQLCTHIYDSSGIHHRFLKFLDWEFWITGLVRMLLTENMISQAKSLTFIFNLWDLLPLDYEMSYLDSKDEWIVNPRFSLIYNLTFYLISKDSWNRFFIHWLPLVRHFYHRLIVFKIVGNNPNVNEYELSKRFNNGPNSIRYRKLVHENLIATYNAYEKNSKTISNATKFDLLPSNPILNKKLIISSMNLNSKDSFVSNSRSVINILEAPLASAPISKSSSASTLVITDGSVKKVYAFDIFDDAIYSASMGSVSNSSINLNLNKAIPRSFSRSSLNSLASPPPQRSPTISRSASSTSLNKVPLLSSALSFFKKVNGASPTLPITKENEMSLRVLSSTSISSLASTKTSPSLRSSYSNFGNGIVSSPSSSISENSDDEQSNISLYPQLNSKRSSSQQSFTQSSRVSSTSSITSIMSTSVSSSQPGINGGNSMDSIPPPPEFLINVPELKLYRYKFQLATSDDYFRLFHSRFINVEKTDSSDSSFFQIQDLIDVEDILPTKPRLPFESSTIGSSGVGLIIDDDEADDDDDDDDDDEDDDDDDDESFSSPPSSTSFELLRNDKSYDGKHKFFQINSLKRNTVKKVSTNETLYNNVTNWGLLGKVLNEWDLVVDEYERYINLINSELINNDNHDTEKWFVDPMLLCDIPPTKLNLMKDY